MSFGFHRLFRRGLSLEEQTHDEELQEIEQHCATIKMRTTLVRRMMGVPMSRCKWRLMHPGQQKSQVLKLKFLLRARWGLKMFPVLVEVRSAKSDSDIVGYTVYIYVCVSFLELEESRAGRKKRSRAGG